jgi:hypothetical protein
MAANFSSSSDTEEYTTPVLLYPYQFEPTKDSSSSDDNSRYTDSSSSSGSEHESSENRRENTDWCKCGRCDHTLLKRDKEHLCCQEKPNLQIKAEEYPGELVTIKFHPLLKLDVMINDILCEFV